VCRTDTELTAFLMTRTTLKLKLKLSGRRVR